MTDHPNPIESMLAELERGARARDAAYAAGAGQRANIQGDHFRVCIACGAKAYGPLLTVETWATGHRIMCPMRPISPGPHQDGHVYTREAHAGPTRGPWWVPALWVALFAGMGAFAYFAMLGLLEVWARL